MGFWYIPPSGGSSGGGGGGGGGGTTSNIELYDELSAQIDGITDTFTITKHASYVSGSMFCSIGRLTAAKSVDFFELDPSSGKIKTAKPLTPDDAPFIVSYKY